MSQLENHTASRFTRLTLALLSATAASLLLALAPTPALGATGEACPNQTVREQQQSTYLPDCRGYELVSPTQTDGNEVDTQVFFGDTYQAAMEGAGIAYEAPGAFPGSLSSGHSDEYLSESSALGSPWQTLPLSPNNQLGLLPPANGTRFIIGGFSYFSPNLTCAIEDTELPLTALPIGETPAENNIENLYVWNAAAASYTLVTDVKPEGTPGQGEYYVDGASADCSHVIFESGYGFIGAPEGGTLYEWDEGALHVASLLPNDTQPAAGVTRTKAGKGGSDLNEISSDGSHVFFTAKADSGIDSGKEEVFVRENGTSTVEASASQTAAADSGAKFEAASESGEQVFFTANYGLTSSSSTGVVTCTLTTGAGCDLYDYHTATGALTDISADTNPDDTTGADVLGVLGIAEEGGVVYFSASGQLVPGKGNTQATNTADKEANVYAFHEGRLSYVASIGEVEAGGHQEHDLSEEEVDAIADGSGNGSVYTVSRVSGDGEYLLFATSKPIRQSDGVTYDDTDAATGKPDFEDFEYSLGSGSVTCVSCDPSGAPPQLRAGTALFSVEFGQYEQSPYGAMSMLRNLANNGEVYFQTTNPVLPQATNDSLNVYEFQPEGLGSCPSGQAGGCVSILDSGTNPNATYFEGASASGENVYLTTFSELAPEDQNELRAMYDVREDGGFLAPSPPTECEREGTGPNACQGELSQLFNIGTPGSSTGIGGGNLSPPPPPAATLTIVKHSVTGQTATILASVSGIGTVRASGSGVSTAAKSPVEAKTVTLKLKLTQKGKAALAKHPNRALKVKVTLVFTPTSGSAVSKTVTVSFKKAKRAKTAKKAKPRKKKKKKAKN